MILQIIYWCFFLGAAVIVVRLGRQPEWLGLAMMFVASVASPILAADVTVRYRAVDIGLASVDAALLIALLLLALNTKRFWPLWATSFHGVGLFTHFVVSLSDEPLARGYALLQGFWGYPVILSLVCGALTQDRIRQMRAR
jgi:hypothetical protein